jgi:predicted ATPase/transcriptional regulator with XRE-family HTH domain
MEEHSFGYWLRLRRKALDLTQDALADHVGCSVGMIRKIESEERRPSAQIVERLAEILNISQDERTAFLRFARGDWRSVPAEMKEATPWHVSTKSPRSNLPASISSLVGREQAIADIQNYLSREDIRLVTLIGPPGIGKTRLSIETARTELSTFPDGVFFVALAPLEDPSLIALTIVQALGFVEAKNVPARQQLMDGIGEKQMLIVLDNCEHLIEEVAPLTSDLLSACSRLKILATSRESLRVPGEWLYPVPVLDVPKESSSIDVETAPKFPALTLFAERARAVRPDFALNTENIHAVSSICAQLDGLPLAIELIAARMRLMSPAALLEHWNARFILSADGVRAVSTRQRTLNNAIAWSYNLLSGEEQKLFAYLSVFSGGFTLDSAQYIFSRSFVEKPVRDLITSLLDKSLLQRVLDDHGEPWFTMLVTIQEFAREHLRVMGDEAKIRNLHLTYFLDLAEQADGEIHGPAQVEWMDRLDMELDNFRAALDWSLSSRQTEKLLQLFAALGWNWMVRWSPSEYRSWLNNIRSLPDIDNHPATYAQILNIAVHQEWIAGNYGEARSFIEESEEIWQELNTAGERGLAEALYLSGMIALQEGDYDESASCFEQSLELYQKCGEPWGVAIAKFLLGNVTLWKDEDSSALLWLTQSLDLFDELGDPWGIARVVQRLGELFLKQALYEKAQLYFDQHLKLDEELHFKQGMVVALYNLGNLYRYQRDFDQAEGYYEKSLALCREYSLKNDRGYNSYGLGMLALHRNKYLLAMRHFTEYFHTARGSYEKITACDFLTGSAAISAAMNQRERAAKLYGAAQALFETTDYRIPPFDRAEFDRHIQMAREQLGEERFEALAAEGHAISIEQAIEYALELATSL